MYLCLGLAKHIPLGEINARRSALEEHGNSLFDRAAADTCWTSDNKLCVKKVTIMVKDMSRKMYEFDDTPPLTRHGSSGRVLQTLTNSPSFPLKRSHTDMSTSSSCSSVSNSNQGFPAYFASAYNTENIPLLSPTADLSKKNCRSCNSVNRVIAIMCSSCQTRFETIPRVMLCNACFQDIDSGMKNCDLCGAMNSEYDGL